MANFKTHFFVAAGVSGVAAIACMKAGVVQATETPVLLALGTFGGLLPDIDSDHSVPIRISFNLLAFALAFLMMSVFINRYTVLELAAVWIGVFVGVRYLVLELFIKLTTHRGSIHSLLAGAFFALCAVAVSEHWFAKPGAIAWMYGAFVGLGFVTHLLLDELFSVDLLNRRVKRSFGTALKIASLEYWQSSLLLLVATLFLYSALSYPKGFYAATWDKLKSHYTHPTPWLAPRNGRWFSDIGGILARSFCLTQRQGAETGGKPPKRHGPAE